MISLDPIHHKVIIGSQSVELQPLTFGLFAKLFEHRNQVVSITVLTDEVWGNVTVSPDTLKQRIFLLRKALEEAGVEACTVQSVRGQGYRLVVPEEKWAFGTTIDRRRLWRAYGLIAIAVFVAVYVWQGRQPIDLPPNNRVVFWKASPTDSIGDDAGNWEQMWITRLSSSDKMRFVASRRDLEQTISEQARQTRTALVSRWTLFENDGQRWVRMQILEPKTAGILRSDLAALDDSDAMAEKLALQTDAIERILESGVLPLSREALNSTDHPAWARLRDLANEPGQ